MRTRTKRKQQNDECKHSMCVLRARTCKVVPAYTSFARVFLREAWDCLAIDANRIVLSVLHSMPFYFFLECCHPCFVLHLCAVGLLIFVCIHWLVGIFRLHLLVDFQYEASFGSISTRDRPLSNIISWFLTKKNSFRYVFNGMEDQSCFIERH